jgi:hypothetical protein
VKPWTACLLVAGVLVLLISCVWQPALVGALLIGWIQYLARVLPRMTVDRGTVVVGTVAFVLFAAGVHWIGRSWRPRTAAAPWRLRWSMTCVALVVLMFTAGLAVIAIVHQVAWTASAREPLWVHTVGMYSSERGSREQLRWLGMATHDYASAHANAFPTGGTFTDDGTGLHSWEARMLGFDNFTEWDPEGDRQRIDFTVPWNHERNAPIFKRIHPLYLNGGLIDPPVVDAEGYGLSHYSANVHVMGPNRGLKLTEITDGLGQTLLVGEVNTAFKPWGHPCNWRDPAHGINRSPQGFGGPPSQRGAWFAMADGSARFVSDRVSPEVLRALATPAGGETVDPPPER